jgi:hypothetical protein
LFVINGKLDKKSSRLLIDSGATHEFVSQEFLDKEHVPYEKDCNYMCSVGGQSTQVPLVGTVVLPVRIDSFREDRLFYVLNMKLDTMDAVLGKPFLTQHNAQVDWQQHVVRFFHNGQEHTLRDASAQPEPPLPKLNTISARGIVKLLRQRKVPVTVFAVYVTQIEPTETPKTPLSGKEQILAGPIKGNPAYIEKIKPLLLEFSVVFDPPTGIIDRPIQHSIRLKPNTEPPYRNPYRLSPKKLLEARRQIEHLLKIGHIRPSTSPYGAPILFVDKKDSDELRMCVDYTMLNKSTIRDAYPIPRIDQLMDLLQGKKIFTKLDLTAAFNQIPMNPDDIEKTAFNTRYGQYEYTVLPFGLCNGPATCMRLMQDVLSDYLDKFVMVYLDDCLQFNDCEEDAIRDLRLILQRLKDNDLHLKLSKCVFGVDEVDYLGHVVSKDGLKVDPKKVEAVKSWPEPTDLGQLRSFMGLVGYYRKFVPALAQIALPLSELVKKNVPWIWSDQQRQAFERLKEALTTAPVLAIPQFGKPYIIYTDASDYAVGAVLLQDQGDGPRPCAYFSRKLRPAEKNYSVGDKELLAIICALREYSVYIQGVPTKLYTDHANHKTLFSRKAEEFETPRVARWICYLQRFLPELEILYKRGAENQADALSRRPDLMLNLLVIPLPQIQAAIRAAYLTDPAFSDADFIQNMRTARGFWFHNGRLVIPNNLDIIRTILEHCHDNAGHLGIDKTQELVQRRFWWPKLVEHVREYVLACSACALAKSRNHRVPGLMVPLPIPSRPWECVTVDLVTDMPPSQGKDAFVVFVDKLTKMIVALPVTKTITSGRLAKIFKKEIVRRYGMPDYLISDRDTRFLGRPWRSYLDQNNIQHKMSTAYHPQTDGQTERANRTILDMLRAVANARMDNWVSMLPQVVSHYNNSVNLSTGYSPFYLNYGYHPVQPIDQALPRIPNTTANAPVGDAMRARTQAITNLRTSQLKQKKYHDKHRRHEAFQPNDMVYLSTSDLRRDGPRKLQDKWIGPFRVIRNIRDVSYELEMPATMGRIHRVFHVSKLKKFKPDTIFQRTPPPAQQLGRGWWTIEDIYGHRQRRGRTQYKVRWLGYGREMDQWLDSSALTRDAIDEYWESLR